MSGATLELREDPSDSLATPDVDRLNMSYLAVHGSVILGRPMWLTTSSLASV